METYRNRGAVSVGGNAVGGRGIAAPAGRLAGKDDPPARYCQFGQRG